MNASPCKMIYVQIVEGCFHIYLLKVESFCVLRPTSRICDIITIRVQYSIYTSVMLKLKACNAQTQRLDLREGPAVKLEIKYIYIFIDSGDF